MDTLAFIFPGQGAQYIGMGKDFYDSFSVVRHTLEEAEDQLSMPLRKVMFEGPEEELTKTRNAQVAIFVMSMALHRLLQQQFPSLQSAVCAGLSLGEYSALCASGRLGFAATLQLVFNRASYMEEACLLHKGTMAVIMGLPNEQVEELVKELHLPQDVWTANFNCPEQVVVSGTHRGVEAACLSAKAKGAKRVLLLAVQGAFHSGLMKSAQEKLQSEMAGIVLQDSPVDFVMNVVGDYVKDLKKISQNLVSQVTGSVRWESGIRAMVKKGVQTFVEIGPGKTLSGMNRRIAPEKKSVPVEKLKDLETYATLLNHYV